MDSKDLTTKKISNSKIESKNVLKQNTLAVRPKTSSKMSSSTTRKPLTDSKPSKSSTYSEYIGRRGPQAIGSKPIPEAVENCLKGMTFTLTGILDCIEREDAIHLIESCGGRVMKSLGKKCDYLIAGRDPGFKTIQSAMNSNKTVLNEEQFFDLIRKEGKNANRDGVCIERVMIDNINCDQIMLQMLRIDIKVEIQANNFDSKQEKDHKNDKSIEKSKKSSKKPNTKTALKKNSL